MPPSAPPRVLIGIPAHNEQHHIAGMVHDASRFGNVVVVDNGSRDLTAHRAQKAGAAVIRFTRNYGKSAAVAALFEEARVSRADFLVLLSGTGEHNPNQIPSVLAPCLNGKADLVVGVPIHDGIPARKVVRQWVVNTLTTIMSGVRCSNFQSEFRAFNRRAITNIHCDEATFSIGAEQQFETKRNRLRLAEVPITPTNATAHASNPGHHDAMVLFRLVAMTFQRRVFATGETTPATSVPIGTSSQDRNGGWIGRGNPTKTHDAWPRRGIATAPQRDPAHP